MWTVISGQGSEQIPVQSPLAGAGFTCPFKVGGLKVRAKSKHIVAIGVTRFGPNVQPFRYGPIHMPSECFRSLRGEPPRWWVHQLENALGLEKPN